MAVSVMFVPFVPFGCLTLLLDGIEHVFIFGAKGPVHRRFVMIYCTILSPFRIQVTVERCMYEEQLSGLFNICSWASNAFLLFSGVSLCLM